MQIVLASSSKYRKLQLASLGISFDCISPDIDESPAPKERADSLAQRLAAQKALSVAHHYRHALIIGSDQTASCEGRLLGKPGDYLCAVEQLQWLGGKQAVFYSAITLLDTRNNRLQQHTTETVVIYRKLNDRQIENYLKYDKPFDCTGSFKSESLGIAILASVASHDPSALVGLPLIALSSMLASTGLDLLDRDPPGQHS